MTQTIDTRTSIFTKIYVNGLLHNVLIDIREKIAIQNLSTSISCQRDVWKHLKNLHLAKLERVHQYMN